MNSPYRVAPSQPKRSWLKRPKRSWLKRAIVSIGPFGPLLVMVLFLITSSCSWFAKPDNTTKVIKSVLDVAQIACVLVHDWSDDDSWIAKQCDIADDYLPEVRKLVAARKRAAAMKASGSMDAGVSHD